MDQFPDWQHVQDIQDAIHEKPWEQPDPATILCYFLPKESSQFQVVSEFFKVSEFENLSFRI
jgi:hypothetical protein